MSSSRQQFNEPPPVLPRAQMVGSSLFDSPGQYMLWPLNVKQACPKCEILKRAVTDGLTPACSRLVHIPSEEAQNATHRLAVVQVQALCETLAVVPIAASQASKQTQTEAEPDLPSVAPPNYSDDVAGNTPPAYQTLPAFSVPLPPLPPTTTQQMTFSPAQDAPQVQSSRADYCAMPSEVNNNTENVPVVSANHGVYIKLPDAPQLRSSRAMPLVVNNNTENVPVMSANGGLNIKAQDAPQIRSSRAMPSEVNNNTENVPVVSANGGLNIKAQDAPQLRSSRAMPSEVNNNTENVPVVSAKRGINIKVNVNSRNKSFTRNKKLATLPPRPSAPLNFAPPPVPTVETKTKDRPRYYSEVARGVPPQTRPKIVPGTNIQYVPAVSALNVDPWPRRNMLDPKTGTTYMVQKEPVRFEIDTRNGNRFGAVGDGRPKKKQ